MKQLLTTLLLIGLFFIQLFSQNTIQYPDNELSIQTTNASGQVVSFTLKPVSALYCWSEGTAVPSADNQTIQSNLTPDSYGNSICPFNGFTLRDCTYSYGNVILPGCNSNDPGVKAMRYGFYRIDISINGEIKNYLYYDNRDLGFPNGSNCLYGNDLTVRWKGSLNKIWLHNSGNLDTRDPMPEYGWEEIPKGGIVRFWQYKSCNTRIYQPFWDNGLVVVPEKQTGSDYAVPRIVWGPYQTETFIPNGYRIYRGIGDPTNPPSQYTLLTTVGAGTTEFIHNDVASIGPGVSYYKVQAFNSSSSSPFTNVSSTQNFWHGNATVNSAMGSEGVMVPHIQWQPYLGFEPTTYRIYWCLDVANNGCNSFQLLTEVSASTLSFLHEGISTGTHWTARYKVQAVRGSILSSYSNTTSIGVSGFYKEGSKKNNEEKDNFNETWLKASPNPFNPTTNLYYNLLTSCHVILTVHDLLGREVLKIFDGVKTAGNHRTIFDGSTLASGIYFVLLSVIPQDGSKPLALTKKIILVR